MPISLSGSLLLTGSLTATSTITAQKLVVQVITSSIVNFTGSNTFGSSTANIQEMTGSLRVTGSGAHYILGGNVGIGTTTPDNTYQGLTIFGTNPSLRLKTSDPSGWNWIECVNSSGVNNVSFGVNQTSTYFGVNMGAGMDNPEFIIISGSNNVGIGTTSPNRRGYDANARVLTVFGRQRGILELGSETPINNDIIGGIVFQSGSLYKSQIMCRLDGASSASFEFYTGASNNASFYISASGNVGIGTTTPSTPLQVNGRTNIVNKNGYGFAHYDLTGSNNQYLISQHLSASNGFLLTTGYNGTSLNPYFALGTNDTAVLTISGSNVGIGTTTPAYKLDVNGTFRSNALWTDASAVAYWGSGVTPTVYGVLTWDTSLARIYANTGNRLELGANATVYLTVGTTGNVTLNSTVYNNTAAATVRTLYIGGDYIIGGVSSTRESKTNIENITDVNWLYELNPVSFNYRKKNASGSYTEEYYEDKAYGLIAEDTAPVNDLLCNYNQKEDGSKELVGIEYPRLIVPLLKAVQELKAENTALKSRIEQLETKIQ